MKTNKVVLVPVRNALSYFKDMIESLYTYTDNFLLFLLDDASDRATKNFISKLRPHKLFVQNQQLFWTRTSNNLLLAAYLYSDADYFFLLNTDIILCKNWAETLISHFSLNDRILLTGSDYSPPKKNVYVQIPSYLTGHCLCFSRRCIDIAGLLDESRPHIGSDQHYSYRIIDKGYKVFRDTQLPIIHSSIGPSWNRDLSKLLNIDRRLPPPRPINISYYL